MTRLAVLVTGGAGYVGSHACKALAEAGFRPVVYDNLSTGHADAVQWGPLVVGDLADRERLCEAIERHAVSAVLHFAASSCVGESARDPGLFFRNNVANSLTLLDMARGYGLRHVVFSSSCAVYGDPQSLPMAEDHPQAPVSAYGESKRMVEGMLKWFGQAHGLGWVALRYFNAAGADPQMRIGERHEPESHLIPLVLEAAAGQRPALRIFGTDYPTPDGTAVRDYIHVDDLADAHVAALRYLLAGGAPAAINLGTGRGHSVRQVVACCEQVTGLTVPVVEAARRPGDPPVLVADARTAARLLGWTARRSELADVVASAWRWSCRRRFGSVIVPAAQPGRPPGLSPDRPPEGPSA